MTLLFLTGLFEDLPEATLAAVVIAAVIELVDIPAIRRLYRIYAGPTASPLAVAPRADFVAAVAALFGVLVFDTLPGLFIGIGVSFLLFSTASRAPHIAVLGKVPGTRSQYGDLSRHEENQEVPGVLIVRPDGGLFFANADHIRLQILAAVEREQPHAVIVDGATMPFIDVTAVEMLVDLTEDLGRRGITLALARDIGEVRDIVRRTAGDGGGGPDLSDGAGRRRRTAEADRLDVPEDRRPVVLHAHDGPVPGRRLLERLLRTGGVRELAFVVVVEHEQP